MSEYGGNHGDRRADLDAAVPPDLSVASNLSMASWQTRARRQERLEAVLERAKELRADALRLVHRGGVDVVNQTALIEDISPGTAALWRISEALACSREPRAFVSMPGLDCVLPED